MQKDIKNTINWAVKDLSSLSFHYFDHLYQIEKLIENERDFCGIIVDSKINDESSLTLLPKIREKSKSKILLIVSTDTSKQDIVELIKNKLVDNVIIRPFNANQIVDAVAKLCAIEKPSEKPWYMYTKQG